MAKKLISLLLATVLCVGVLAACGPRNNEPTLPPDIGEIPTGPYVTPDLNGATVEVYVISDPGYDPNTTYGKGVAEKALDMKLKYTVLTGTGATYQAVLAEGTRPDVTYFGGYNQSYTTYGQDGAYINIYDYLDYMPNLKAFIEEHKDDGLLDKFFVEEGVMYAAPILGSNHNNSWTYLYREDIFAENNLTWPTNQADFEATLRTLKQKYPDSYPFAMRQLTGQLLAAQKWSHLWGGIAIGYSTYNTFFTMGDDGKYYYGLSSEGHKEMAEYMLYLTNEGLMHPSCFTMTQDQWMEAFSSNTSFITYDKVERIPYLNAAGKNLNPNFKMTVGAPFNMGSHAQKTDVVSTTFTNTFTSGCYLIGQGDNIVNSIKYVDWLYSEEGIIASNWGVKGESYEEDAEGNKHYKEGFLANNGGDQKKAGLSQMLGSGVVLTEAYMDTIDEDMKEAYELAAKYEGKDVYQPFLSFTSGEQFIWETYGKPMVAYARKEWSKFALGQRDFSEWEKFQKELKDSYGYDILMTIHNDALARINGK